VERVRHPAGRGPQALEPQPLRLPRGRPPLVERKAEPGIKTNANHHDVQYARYSAVDRDRRGRRGSVKPRSVRANKCLYPERTRGFAVQVTLIEPAGYSTDWSGSSAQHSTELPAYDPVREQAAAARKARFTTPGDPTATRQAILTLVDSENPPLRLFLGESPLGIATADYESRLASWREWQPVAVAAQGNPQG